MATRYVAALFAVVTLAPAAAAQKQLPPDMPNTRDQRVIREADDDRSPFRRETVYVEVESRPEFASRISSARADVAKLARLADELAARVAGAAPDLDEARDQAKKVRKTSRSAFNGLRGRAAPRDNQPEPVAARPFGAVVRDVADIKALVGEVAAVVLAPEAERQIDVKVHTAILAKLERIEDLARQVEVDLKKPSRTQGTGKITRTR